MLFYENVYRNIHKELIEVASKPEKRHKILLEPYEMVKPIIGKKGRNHQAIVDITDATKIEITQTAGTNHPETLSA